MSAGCRWTWGASSRAAHAADCGHASHPAQAEEYSVWPKQCRWSGNLGSACRPGNSTAPRLRAIFTCIYILPRLSLHLSSCQGTFSVGTSFAGGISSFFLCPSHSPFAALSAPRDDTSQLFSLGRTRSVARQIAFTPATKISTEHFHKTSVTALESHQLLQGSCSAEPGQQKKNENFMGPNPQFCYSPENDIHLFQQVVDEVSSLHKWSCLVACSSASPAPTWCCSIHPSFHPPLHRLGLPIRGLCPTAAGVCVQVNVLVNNLCGHDLHA